jgi:hypothetical protein
VDQKPITGRQAGRQNDTQINKFSAKTFITLYFNNKKLTEIVNHDSLDFNSELMDSAKIYFGSL